MLCSFFQYTKLKKNRCKTSLKNITVRKKAKLGSIRSVLTLKVQRKVNGVSGKSFQHKKNILGVKLNRVMSMHAAPTTPGNKIFTMALPRNSTFVQIVLKIRVSSSLLQDEKRYHQTVLHGRKLNPKEKSSLQYEQNQIKKKSWKMGKRHWKLRWKSESPVQFKVYFE